MSVNGVCGVFIPNRDGAGSREQGKGSREQGPGSN